MLKISVYIKFLGVSMSRLEQRIENFQKSFEILSKSVIAYNNDKQNDVMHMALIQSFEVTFELGRKVLKDYLEDKEIIVQFPKDVIKEAFQKGVISEGQMWIDMLKDRNISSHEYNMDKIDKVLENISNIYFEEMKRFSQWLGGLNG